MGHARALLSLKHPKKIEQMANASWRKTGTSVGWSRHFAGAKGSRPSATSDRCQFVEESLREKYGATVRIKQGKQAGKLEIDFADEDDLNRLLDLLLPESDQ